MTTSSSKPCNHPPPVSLRVTVVPGSRVQPGRHRRRRLPGGKGVPCLQPHVLPAPGERRAHQPLPYSIQPVWHQLLQPMRLEEARPTHGSSTQQHRCAFDCAPEMNYSQPHQQFRGSISTESVCDDDGSCGSTSVSLEPARCMDEAEYPDELYHNEDLAG